MSNYSFYKKFIFRLVFIFLYVLDSYISHSQPANEQHGLVYWAQLLVSHINEQNTDYRHRPTSVTWAGYNGAVAYESFADCSGFMNSLIEQTYKHDEIYMANWLKRKRPLAYNYYYAISREDRFKKVNNIGDIEAGDIIAIKFNSRPEHRDNTGHVLLIVKLPWRLQADTLTKPDMGQYAVTVIDATKSPHGRSDSRYKPGGASYPGLGMGVFGLYADEKGIIKGYGWSTGKPKKKYDPFGNPLIIGRIIQ